LNSLQSRAEHKREKLGREIRREHPGQELPQVSSFISFEEEEWIDFSPAPAIDERNEKE
jgi:hypothetical protein